MTLNRGAAVLLFAACNMNLTVDPEGHRCSDEDPCPASYACQNFACRAISAEGGGAGGGSASSGGRFGGGGGLCDCADAPASICVGTVARSFRAPARCNQGQCTWEKTDLECAPGTCSSGLCSLNLVQTGPRLRFAINGIDLAPMSDGDAVLAIGEGSQVAAWNGTRWNTVPPPAPLLSLKAVDFSSASQAWVVGESRTAWRWDKASASFVPTPTSPGLPATTTLVAVDGINNSTVLVADAVGRWATWNGSGWTDGGLPTTNASNFAMTSVWVDEGQRQRIAGTCTNTSGQRRSCVAYRSPATGSWFVDTSTDARGCNALGPSLDVPTMGGQDAVCGFGTDTQSIRHTVTGTFASNSALVLNQGNGIAGITGGPIGGANRRTVWVLTQSTRGAPGALYRVTGSNAVPLPAVMLDTYAGEEHLSRTESSGVLVAEVDRARNVNNVFFVRTNPVERLEALDLAVDFTGVTPFGQDLALVSSIGDLAVRRQGSNIFEFRRPPSASQYRIEDVEGRNGAQDVLVVGRDAAGSGLVARVSLNRFTRLAFMAPQTVLKSVCRAAEGEAFAVGTGGALYAINDNAVTRDPQMQINSDLQAVDCPISGEAVACGSNSLVLRRRQGVWSTLPFPLPSKTFTSCVLVDGTVWLAGDQVFARLDADASGWTVLPAHGVLQNLVVRAPNDVLAAAQTATTFELVRFDGMNWNAVSGPHAGSAGGAALFGGKPVFVGSAGTIIEAR